MHTSNKQLSDSILVCTTINSYVHKQQAILWLQILLQNQFQCNLLHNNQVFRVYLGLIFRNIIFLYFNCECKPLTTYDSHVNLLSFTCSFSFLSSSSALQTLACVDILSLFSLLFLLWGGGQVSKFEFKFLASGLCKNGYIHCSPEVQKQPLKNASTSQITQGWYFLWQGSVSTSFRPSKEFFSLS